MATPNDGGAAFPSAHRVVSNHHGDPDWRVESAGGMSLRDWFAGQALVGMLSNPAVISSLKELGDNAPHTYAAEAAYGMAEAMLAVREQPH